MAFTVNFYSLSKRENSTKRPSGNGTEFSCNIKMPSGVINPVIELSTTTNMTQYNYCKIGHFQNRYYFVSDWVSDHGLWIAHLKVDVLATYKTEIGNSTQYILRASSKTNGSIPNTAYPVTSVRDATSIYVNNPLKLSSGTKVDYVLGVLNFDNTSDTKINGIQYVVLSESQMREFTNLMLTQDYFGLDALLTAIGVNAAFMHSICNPAQYIVESYVLPHSSMASKTVSNLRLGPWAIRDMSSMSAFSAGYSHNVTEFSNSGSAYTFTIPSHPQASTHGTYLNSAPYAHHVLHAGPFGDIPLDFVPSDVQATIKYKIYMDFKGNCELYLMDNDLNVLVTAFANVAIQIPIIASSDKPLQMASAIGQEVSSGITSMGLSTAGSWGRVTDAVAEAVPKITATNTGGGVLSVNQEWYLTSVFNHVSCNVISGTAGMATNKIGAPLCDTFKISDLSNFIMCDKSIDLALDCYASEFDMVKGYMTSGFYYED